MLRAELEQKQDAHNFCNAGGLSSALTRLLLSSAGFGPGSASKLLPKLSIRRLDLPLC